MIVKNGLDGTLAKPAAVVEADNAIVDFTRLRWSDANHLHVSLCEATSYHVIAETLREPAYIDAGRGDGEGVPNAVWVEVENLAYSERAKACLPRGNAV